MYLPFLSAMELVELTNLSKKSASINDYGLLTENTLDIIQKQKTALSNPVLFDSVQSYFNAIHSSLALDQWYQAFSTLSETCKRKAMKIMSTQLLYLHVVALCLPPEIVKNHIIFFLLDGYKEAVEQFYTVSFVQAFDVYHEIKIELTDDTKPVGPLYAQSQKMRDLIFKMQKNPWYYSLPIVEFEDKQEIAELPEDIKNIYLGGKSIFILPDEQHNFCTPNKICRGTLISSCTGLGSFGLMSGAGAAVGACNGCGPQLACVPIFLKINVGMSCAFGCAVPCFTLLLTSYRKLQEYSEYITI